MILYSILDPSRLRRSLLLLCAAALLWVPAARADFVISVSSSSAFAGSGSTLEVDLTNTGSSAQTFGGFSFGLSTTSPDITFTGATTATAAPYIFAPDSLFGPNIATTTGLSLVASDLAAIGDSVGAGATVGLGLVSYNVAPGTSAGSIAVALAAFPTTSLSDTSGGNISFTPEPGGLITVLPSASGVPEPSTLVLAMLACPAGVWAAWRRRAGKRPETNAA